MAIYANLSKALTQVWNPKKTRNAGGLWQKCPECGEVIHNLELGKNLKVCPKCDHHFTLSAAERIHNLLDPDSFEEFDANLISKDVLKFTGVLPIRIVSKAIRRRPE